MLQALFKGPILCSTQALEIHLETSAGKFQVLYCKGPATDEFYCSKRGEVRKILFAVCYDYYH